MPRFSFIVLVSTLCWRSPHATPVDDDTDCRSGWCSSPSFGNSLLQAASHLTKTRATVLAAKKLEPLGKANERCYGTPPGGWGNLGKGLSEKACQDACLSNPACKFLTFKAGKKSICTYFEECEQQLQKGKSYKTTFFIN